MSGSKGSDTTTSRKPPIEFFQKQLVEEKPLTFATAERLFELATDLIAISPWQFLEDQNLILLKDPISGETCHCSVMGALGEVFSLHVYIGAESYRYFRKMAAGTPISIGELYGSLRGVYVEFVKLSELTAPDRGLVRTFGHPLAKGLRAPIFRALRPGYHPWYVTEGEGTVLAACMEAVLALCERVLKGDDIDYWKGKGVYPSMVPIADNREGKKYEVEMVKVPEPPTMIPEVPDLDQTRVRKVREMNYPVQGAFEVDHFYGGGMIGRKNERKACFRVGMVADAHTGFVFHPELGMSERATADILVSAILSAVESAHSLPREIRVNQTQFKALLDPLTREFGVSVRVVARLPVLGEAREHLLRMMGDPGPLAGC